MQLRGNFPIVTVKLDGREVPLAFDLGDTSALVLSQKILNGMKTVPLQETQGLTDVQGIAIQGRKFKVTLLQIGTVRFTNVIGRVKVHDPTYQGTDVGQQGTFGTSLLQSYKVILDYPHRKMTLLSAHSKHEKTCSAQRTVVPFLPNWNGHPVTKVSTDFGELTAVWDTGSPISILRKPGAQNIGDNVLTESVITQRLNLGGTDFGPLKLEVADHTEPAGSDMFVGYNFFMNHLVCVDFSRASVPPPALDTDVGQRPTAPHFGPPSPANGKFRSQKSRGAPLQVGWEHGQ